MVNPSLSGNSRLDTLSFYSQSLNQNRQFKIYLPPGYQSTASALYPSVYFLHGYPGNFNDWLVNNDLKVQLDQLILTNKIPPIIAVFPDGNGPRVTDSQYANGTQIKQPMEDALIELVRYIDAHYHTIPSANYRALAGVSSGAYAALNVGFHYPEIFGHLLSFSGYINNQEPAAKKLFGTDQAAYTYNNPSAYLSAHTLNPKPTIYLFTGNHDYARFIQENAQLCQYLKDHQFQVSCITGEGIHGWVMWRKYVPQVLSDLGKQLTPNAGPTESQKAGPSPAPTYTPRSTVP